METTCANKSFTISLPADIEAKLTYQKNFSLDVFGELLYRNKSLLDKKFLISKGLTSSDIVRKINRICHCSDMIELRENIVTGNVRVSNARYCKQPLVCSMCSSRIQAVRRKKYEEPLTKAIKKYRYAYLLTATIKDTESLDEGLITLRSGIRSFVRMGQRRKKRLVRDGVKITETFNSEGEFAKVKAGFFSIEIKRGIDSALWHPHAHGLFFTNEMLDYVVYDPLLKKQLVRQYGENIPKEKLDEIAIDKVNKTSKISREWMTATNGLGVSIDISPVTTSGGSIVAQCKEVIKYTSLLNPHQKEDSIEIIVNTYNKRFFSTYGEFRKINQDDYEDLDKDENEKIYYAVWNREARRYGRANPSKSPMFASELIDKRKKLLGDQAKMLGECRRNKRILLESAEYVNDENCDRIEAALNAESEKFRIACVALWQDYHEYEYQRPEPEPLQIDLFLGIPEPEDESWRQAND